MKKILLIFTLIFAFVLIAQSQSVLNVVEAWGGRSAYNTGEVNKLTFSGGELQVFDTRGATHSYVLNDVLSLNFRNYPILTSIPSIVHSGAKETSLYPNPASDMLYFKSTFLENDKVSIEILSLDGRTLISRNTNASDLSINVSSLSPGVYICRISSQKERSSSKFIKK